MALVETEFTDRLATLTLNLPERRNALSIEMCNAPDIVKYLAEKKIIVSARGKGLRVSVHIFNNFADIDRLLAALRDCPRRQALIRSG